MATREAVSAAESTPAFRPVAIVLSLAAAIAVFAAPIPGLEPGAHRTLAILTLVAALWMSEALPIPVTALMIPVLGILLGVKSAKDAFAGFGDPIVFLFFGTFLLTDAAERHGLNARLARAVLSSRGVAGHPGRLLWAIALLGFGISAWVNNTATTAMLLPLALTSARVGSPRLVTAVLLMTAWAPSLGGLATPVGTAPNLIGLRLLEQVTGSRPSFAQWCAVMAPLALIATVMAAGWLWWRLGRGASAPAPEAPPPAHPPPRAWSRAERTLILVFVLVVALWITPGILAATPLAGTPWVTAWQTRLPEPAVPLLGALALFLLPAAGRGAAGDRILDVGALKRVDWGTLLLFGGGLSLGAMMFDSGLARTLGEWVYAALPLKSVFGQVLAATILGVVVSELTSNTASAALVVPVVLALAQTSGIDPVKPALAATVGCSFGFMLPVSTPPNALVYGTGRLRLRDMVAHGVVLDIAGVLLVSVWLTVLG